MSHFNDNHILIEFLDLEPMHVKRKRETDETSIRNKPNEASNDMTCRSDFIQICFN